MRDPNRAQTAHGLNHANAFAIDVDGGYGRVPARQRTLKRLPVFRQLAGYVFYSFTHSPPPFRRIEPRILSFFYGAALEDDC
jgi:hypothetical protein